jgi:general secretion pathway protein A
MGYAIQQRKLGVFLTGEYGTGKTFLSRVLKRNFMEERYIFVFINNPRVSPLELIKEVNYQLDGKVDMSSQPTKMDYLRSIKNTLEDYNRKDIYVVMVIDEAQSIKEEDLLEEIRLLLNIQSEERVLFTLIMMGQPQLEDKIENIPQLKQRLSIRYRLAPLNGEETREYIDYRLKVGGTDRKIFTDSAYEEVFSLSGGMPRAINNICDLALLSAFTQKLDMVNRETVIAVGKDLGESPGIKEKSRMEGND